jgi:hypothetical protein
MARIKGQLIRGELRKRTQPNRRDKVITASEDLIEKHGDRAFGMREVYERLLETGTSYAELTAYKAMERMKQFDPRRPDVRLVCPNTNGDVLLMRAVTASSFVVRSPPELICLWSAPSDSSRPARLRTICSRPQLHRRHWVAAQALGPRTLDS